MNEHFKAKEHRMTVEEAVAKGAEIFDGAEERAKWVRKNFRDLKEVFETVRDGGFLGGIETQALVSEADALATQFVADVYALHARLTEKAKEAGIDLPAPMSGGGR